MKKLQLNQMENLEGGTRNRDCFIMGAATGALAIAAVLHPVAAWSQVFAGGGIGGFFNAVNEKCF